MKLYCPKCYNKIDYKFTKPKFCTECGASTSTAPDIKVNSTEKNEDKLKIELLEKKIKELSASGEKNSKNKLPKQHFQADDTSDVVDIDEEDEDYDETQRHIDNFKRKNKKSGITVEYVPANSSISFGKLMENAASGNTSNSEEFKMTEDDAPMKSTDKILEELRIESAGEARVIEIE